MQFYPKDPKFSSFIPYYNSPTKFPMEVIMKTLTLIFGLGFSILTHSLIGNEIKIAVIDLEAAISSSDAATRVENQMDKEFEVDKKTLLNMRMEIDDLVAKQTKGIGQKVEKENKQLTQDIENKTKSYDKLFEEISKRSEQRYEELVKNINPLIQRAIKEVLESGEYDLIHRSKDLLYSDPKFDISEKLTARLNQLTATESSFE